MDRFGSIRRSEMLMRAARDSSLAEAQREMVRAEQDIRPFLTTLDVAISNALIQYAAMMQVEINRIDAADERRMDEALLRMPQLFVKGA